MKTKRILLLGIDPTLIDLKKSVSGRTEQSINTTRLNVTEELSSLGYDVDNCIIDNLEEAENSVMSYLSANQYDCIMIGGGIRGLLQYNLLFEKIVNLIHVHAPTAKFCFNTGPETTV